MFSRYTTEGLTDFTNFWSNIPDTTGHPMTVQVPTSPNVQEYMHYLEKSEQAKCYIFTQGSMIN